jgi:hypothetical protein
LGWHDVTKLMQDKRTLNLSDQLYRAAGSTAPTSPRVIHAAPAKIERGSMNTRWDQPARAAIGIIKHGMSWAKESHSIAQVS